MFIEQAGQNEVQIMILQPDKHTSTMLGEKDYDNIVFGYLDDEVMLQNVNEWHIWAKFPPIYYHVIAYRAEHRSPIPPLSGHTIKCVRLLDCIALLCALFALIE